MQEQLQAVLAILPTPWTGLRPELQLHPQSNGATLLEDPQSRHLYELSTQEASFLKALAANGLEVTCQQSLAQGQSTHMVAAQIKAFQSAGFCRAFVPPTPAKSWSPYWRVPLWRPQNFIQRWQGLADRLSSQSVRLAITLMGLVALAGIASQLELYLATANYLTTSTGVLALLACLAVLKFGHECAHAFTANRYGVPVRQMGVLFVLIWPLLFTDVTDAWKLENRRQRAKIALAGVRFELAVAAVAGFLWLWLPDGWLRSLAFIFSGTALLSSLLINLNPLMRFDGYYALMDLWGMTNLQQSAANYCQQWRRHWMWGEARSQQPNRSLLIYGQLAWLWRWLIAVSLTSLAGYSLGLVAGVLMGVFFMRTMLWQPLKQEWQFLSQSKPWRRTNSRISLILLGLLALLLLVPLPASQHWVATLSPAERQYFSAPVSATLKQALPLAGEKLSAGAVVLLLANQGLEKDLALAEQEQQLRQRQYDALLLKGEQGGRRQTALAALSRARQDVEGLKNELAALQKASQQEASVLYRHPDYSAGDAVAAGEVLLITGQTDQAELDIYLSQQQLKQWLTAEHQAKHDVTVVLPSGEKQKVALTINAEQAVFEHDMPESLLDTAGGRIPSRGLAATKNKALGSWYRLRVSAPVAVAANELPVSVVVDGEWRSLVRRAIEALF